MLYAKALVALLGAFALAAAHAATDNLISGEEWIQIAIAVTTAGGVWLTANVPSLPAAKTAVAVLLAVLNLATSYVTGGISTAEWLGLAVAGLTAAGVYTIPNRTSAHAA